MNNKNISPQEAQEILRLANILYFKNGSYEKTHWMGVQTAKCPMDMWVYQELIHKSKTDLLIETGTLMGGSALFFAHMFDILGYGKVVTVDLIEQENLPKHPRIHYLAGSSTDVKILDEIRNYSDQAQSIMVILDSDHKADYKLKELNAYGEFVTPGNYMIAEDSCFDYYPAWPEYGPGPATAVRDFMQTNTQFQIDRSQEKHLITFAPMAFLKKNQ